MLDALIKFFNEEGSPRSYLIFSLFMAHSSGNYLSDLANDLTLWHFIGLIITLAATIHFGIIANRRYKEVYS